ncbi:MAG TPA: anti-sigma factor [Devosiaceae bacterium]
MTRTDEHGREDDDGVAAAEYVLGLLSADDHAAMTARIANDPALARQVAYWRSRFSAFDEGFAEVAPPPAAFRQIERRLFAARPGPRRLLGLWGSLAAWRGAAAGFALLAILAFGLSVWRPAPTTPVPAATALVASLAAQGSEVRMLALFDPSRGELRLTALSGHPGAGKAFQLWLINAHNQPISLGVLPEAPTASITLPSAISAGLTAGSVLAISLEPEGGSPTGAPTGPVVASGAATAV